MARQTQVRISREGFYYAIVVSAVLFGGLSRQLNLLMLLGALLAGPLVFSLVYGRLMLARLQVQRKLPPELRVDQRLIVDLIANNVRRWLSVWTLEVNDSIERECATTNPGQPAEVGVFYPQIPGGETSQVAYVGRLPRRGRYRFGPLRFSTRFPLGLARHSVVLEQTEMLLVHPKLGQLTHEGTKLIREDVAGSQSMRRRGLLEADFYGLRDWRAGDSRRWIHWRTSARRGTMVVRQFEQRRTQDLALLVDLWQPEEPGPSDLDAVEKAVSFVATVIAQTCRQGGHNLILALAAQEPLYHSGAASGVFFREQMDALAVAAAHEESEFPLSLGHALGLVPPSMPVLLVSTREIDWDGLQAAAAQRDVPLRSLRLRAVNVASERFSRLFQA